MTTAAPAGMPTGPAPGAAGGPGGPLPSAGAPMGGPISNPQPRLGAQQKAKASIEMAIHVISMSQAAFDPMSEEAKAVRKCLDIMAKAFGSSQHDAKELVPTEIAQLMSGMKPPAVGGAAPGGPPGAPPGAPPPGAPPPGA